MGFVALVTNDDGIEAAGLRVLVAALKRRGFRVYIAAPKRPMSGASKSFKMPASFGAAQVGGAEAAWWMDSTPATAVYVALRKLLPVKPDVVVSGINKGPNMGLEDFLTSGTIGAAIEGALQGVHSIAASLAIENEKGPDEYRIAAEVVSGIAFTVSEMKPESFNLLNVNVPPGKPKGALVTKLAFNNYEIDIDVLSNGRLVAKKDSISERYWDRRLGTDVWAVMQGYIALTPIDVKRIANSINNELEGEKYTYLLKPITAYLS